MDILICVGSSCHMKGSYPIIRLFDAWIREYDLSEQVTLKAAFCLGDCTKGVAMRIDGVAELGLTVANAEEVFLTKVLSQFGRSGKAVSPEV